MSHSNVSVIGEAVTDETMNVYTRDLTDLDLNKIAYRGDRNQFRTYMAEKHFVDLIEECRKGEPDAPMLERKKLIASGLRLTPQIAPELFKILDRVRDFLVLKANVELFAFADNSFYAACMTAADGRIMIILSSAILEKFTDNELAFVIGHEIAHSLFGHHRLPVYLLERKAMHFISPFHLLKLKSWQRAQEISADRIGMICAGGFEPAATAFFKLSSGITSKRFSFQLEDYMAQFADLATYLQEEDGVEVEDMYSTHPFSPIRLKALELFSRSELFANLLGKTAFDLTMPQLEAEIASFVKMMEPTYLEDKTDQGRIIREFIFFSGYLIAAADGDLSPEEQKRLSDFLEPEWIESGLREVAALAEYQIFPKILERAKEINLRLPLVSKLSLVRDLISIMTADGNVDQREVRIASMICDALEIKSDFVQDTLSQIDTPKAA